MSPTSTGASSSAGVSSTLVSTAVSLFLAAACAAGATALSYRRTLKETPDRRNCVVLITGCDTGFGKILVKKALAAGFVVVAACFSEEGASALFAAEQPAGDSSLDEGGGAGDRLVTVVGDLTTPEGRQSVVETTKMACSSFGGLYGLVHNAGRNIPGNIDWVQPECYEDCMKLNAFAPIHLTYELLPLLKKKRSSRVICVTCIAGFVPLPATAPYTVSKQALEGYCDVLRIEMRQWGIQVITVQPGTFRTELAFRYPDSFRDTFQKADQDRKDMYGDDEWVNQVHKNLVKFIQRGAEDPYLVGNDLLRALKLENPPSRILPGSAAKFLFLPVSRLPLPFRDRILTTLTSDQTVPTPLGVAVPYPPANQISHVTIRVSDLDRSVAFYKLLGFHKVHEPRNRMQFLKCGDPGIWKAGNAWKPLLLLVEDVSMPPRTISDAHAFGMNRLTLLTGNVDEQVKRLASLRILTVSKPCESIMAKTATYLDPDGFCISFYQVRGFVGRTVQYVTGGEMSIMQWGVNAQDSVKVNEILEALDFQTSAEAYREDVDTNLLAGETGAVFENIRLMRLPRDHVFVSLSEWVDSSKTEGDHAMSNSFSIRVNDVQRALERAKTAGMSVDSDQAAMKSSLPYYGDVMIGRAHLEEGSNPIEFVSF